MLPYRSHPCGSLNLSHVNQPVRLAGWIHAIRRFKRQSFIELRESSGLVQLVVPAHLALELTEESTISIEGVVVPRHVAHPNLEAFPTGQVEVQVSELRVLGKAGPLPFAHHEHPHEEQMLRYRTLALRWPQHQAPLRARAAIVSAMRQVAEQSGCMEVETPVLVRPTPGGATPFLVPISSTEGYALAQSPQIWKQLLVCGGIERYYQLAHCFRNEGARPERQPEFSQFEIELAFTSAVEIQAVMEKMVQAAAGAVAVQLPTQFPKLTYFQAMSQYGSDKPHLGIALVMESPVATPTTRFSHGVVRLPLPRALTMDEQRHWLRWAWEAVGEQGGEVVLPIGNAVIELHGPLEPMQQIMGQLRVLIAHSWALVQPGVYPVWVEQFPLWEPSETGWVSVHHPFTRPLPESETSWSNPQAMMAEAFDLAINGYEVGGGSMRIHELVLQQQVLAFLNIPNAQTHFRPLLEALALGAPPHGGMALGVERLVAVLLGLPHIRATMAFPKTSTGQCLLTQALGDLNV